MLLLLAIQLAACDTDEGEAALSDQERWPLIYAAGEGDSATVEALLAEGSDIKARSKDGETALHVAAIKGDPVTTRALLAAGAEVDARTPKGATIFMTPLMWATYGGHLDQCRLLLEAGADPTAVDENGKSVLEMSREARHADVEALLVEAIERRSTENEKYVA